MIGLDYRTNNPRWGWSGICYSSWENYAFALGYLSNIRHYHNKYTGGTALVDIHFEGNDLQGAWGKEGRMICFYVIIFLIGLIVKVPEKEEFLIA